MTAKFTAWEQIGRLAKAFEKHGRVAAPAAVSYRGESFPLYTFVLGSSAPDAPVFGLVGGVHGLERIGSLVVLSFMEHLLERLDWDEALRWQLQKMRLVFMPLVNPVGMHRKTRSNGNGVDLMRNSPARSLRPTFLVGGHAYSSRLPWYMGSSERMETESQACCDLIRRECFSSSQAIVIDVHSGFGVMDQLWFPYARSQEPFPGLAEMVGLKRLLDRVLPNHVYRFEPQSLNYTTHGDLWDYLYDEHAKQASGSNVFVPLTLEIGSWNWVKKNPWQLFSWLGPYNPVKPHRRKRALRRHLPLFDLLVNATHSPGGWKPATEAERASLHAEGIRLWYPRARALLSADPQKLPG